MLRHTLFVNSMPLAPYPQVSDNLEAQECFNKSLGTVAVLEPSDKAKKYIDAGMRFLRAVCSLTGTQMVTSLPTFHNKLISEEHTKQGADAVLTQEL